jgi:hypothetical protein
VSKQGGLGDNFYVDGNNVSGDIGSIENISSPQKLLDVTGIDKSAYERIGGLRDGEMKWTTFFNAATGKVLSVLKTLPRTNRIATYCRGTTLGNPAASLLALQLNYDGKRANDGAYTFTCEAQANGYGADWGVQLTPGMRTDTAATNGTSVDQTTVSTAFGWQAYLHLNAFTGTDVTIKIQDSADNSTFADLASGAFTPITTTTPQAQRLAVGGTAVVRRYVRVSTVTTGGFTSATFSVMFVRNTAAVSF